MDRKLPRIDLNQDGGQVSSNRPAQQGARKPVQVQQGVPNPVQGHQSVSREQVVPQGINRQKVSQPRQARPQSSMHSAAAQQTRLRAQSAHSSELPTQARHQQSSGGNSRYVPANRSQQPERSSQYPSQAAHKQRSAEQLNSGHQQSNQSARFISSQSTSHRASQRTPQESLPRMQHGRVQVDSQPASYRSAGLNQRNNPAYYSQNEASSYAMGSGNVNGGSKGKAPKEKRGIGYYLAEYPIIKIILIVVLIIAAISIVDAVVHRDTIYDGVYMGELDLGGKTRDEAAVLIEQEFSERLMNGSALVFSSIHGLYEYDSSLLTDEERELMASEVVSEDDNYWTASASQFDVSLPVEDLVQDAIDYGRKNGWIFKRFYAVFFGAHLTPYAAYSDSAIDSFASLIDSAVGVPMVDYNVKITEGVASVTEGTEGEMVDREELKKKLDKIFLLNEAGTGCCWIGLHHVDLRINEASATAVADYVNASICNGVEFKYYTSSWEYDATTLGSWIKFEIMQDGDAWKLMPSVSVSDAHSKLLEDSKPYYPAEVIQVSFTNDNGKITVHTDAEGEVPLIDNALTDLNEALFGKMDLSNEKKTSEQISKMQKPSIEIDHSQVPESLSFEEAVSYGVIAVISTYKTTFTTGSSVSERTHNIELAASLLNNSICKAGGQWSFNETTGPSDAEHGFQSAASIVKGVIVDSIGGGICQVATTVFNAVFEAGYGIDKRQAHQIYVASYPDGRDAAVDYDEVDLMWSNDSDSDVLLVMQTGDGWVSATLWGVSPEYVVEINPGTWKEGSAYKTYYILDESKPTNYKKLRTAGMNGRGIVVWRTVYDKDGEVVRDGKFTSYYAALDEIYVIGPGELADEAKEKNLIIEDPSKNVKTN